MSDDNTILKKPDEARMAATRMRDCMVWPAANGLPGLDSGYSDAAAHQALSGHGVAPAMPGRVQING